jgi:large subunit ribosomal protein L21
MFAVIKTGGKQYLVKEGDVLTVEKLDVEAGKPVEFDVLLVAEEDGSDVQVGTPVLAKKLKGEIVSHGRGAKISVVKYKPKVRYRKRVGHRQPFTKVKIGKIA